MRYAFGPVHQPYVRKPPNGRVSGATRPKSGRASKQSPSRQRNQGRTTHSRTQTLSPLSFLSFPLLSLPSLWLWHTHLLSCPVARLPLARSSHGYGHAARHLLVAKYLRSPAPPASFWSVIRTLFCSIPPCQGFRVWYQKCRGRLGAMTSQHERSLVRMFTVFIDGRVGLGCRISLFTMQNCYFVFWLRKMIRLGRDCGLHFLGYYI